MVIIVIVSIFVFQISSYPEDGDQRWLCRSWQCLLLGSVKGEEKELFNVDLS